MAAPRTRTLPRATPISWEAEAPTVRLPVMRTAPDDLPAATPYGTGPFVDAQRSGGLVAGRYAVGAVAGVLALLIALVLLGGLLELTGAVPR